MLTSLPACWLCALLVIASVQAWQVVVAKGARSARHVVRGLGCLLAVVVAPREAEAIRVLPIDFACEVQEVRRRHDLMDHAHLLSVHVALEDAVLPRV